MMPRSNAPPATPLTPALETTAVVLALRAMQHELHNAVSPMAVLAQMAAADPDDVDLTRRALCSARNTAEAVGAIIDQVLQVFLHLPSGTTGGRCNAAAIVREIVQQRRGLSPSRSYVVTCDESVDVAASPEAVGMVVLNLVLNAETASGPSGTIVCSARNSLEGLRSGIVSIRDSGPGFSAQERLKRAIDDGLSFTSYNQPASTVPIHDESSGGGGPGRERALGWSKPSGLGLMVCRRVLASVGGRLEIGVNGCGDGGAGAEVRTIWPQ